jgi:hypothetical protein
VNFGSPQQSWEYALRRYDRLMHSDAGWEGIDAYRQLVAAVAASEFASRLYALHSLDFLVISPANGWPARSSRPSITLRPRADGQVTLVLYGGPDGRSGGIEEEVWPFDRAWDQLAPWLQWLSEKGAEPDAEVRPRD